MGEIPVGNSTVPQTLPRVQKRHLRSLLATAPSLEQSLNIVIVTALYAYTYIYIYIFIHA